MAPCPLLNDVQHTLRTVVTDCDRQVVTDRHAAVTLQIARVKAYTVMCAYVPDLLHDWCL